jgi:electron transport complex protein RnfC
MEILRICSAFAMGTLVNRFHRGLTTMVSGISSSSLAGLALFSAQTSAASASTGGGSPSAGALVNPQLQDALQALKILRQQGSSAGDAAKGAAMQKLAALKAQLKALMMLGGAPKQRALEAAAIAKQIAAAAEAYAQAGGDSSSSVAAGAGTATLAGPASAPPDQSEGPVSTTPAGAGAPATGQADDGAAGQGQGRGSTGASGGGANAATPSATGGWSQMDQAFVQEARTLAQQAKAIIQAAEQRLKLQHETSDPTAAGAGDAAVAAVGAAANQIGASQAGGYDGSVPTPPAPAISISA